MSYEYEKNSWESYKEDIALEKQPDSIITKKKLDIMELGIERASMTLEPGNITISEKGEPSVSISIDEINHSRKLNIAFPKQTSGVEISDSGISKQSVWSSEKVNSMISELNDKIDELNYKPIEIISFSNNIGVGEKGQTFETVTLRWSMNKMPKSLQLNGQDIDIASSTVRVPDTINSNTTYSLKAVDEKDNFSLKTTSISFINGVYYGVSPLKTIDEITSEFIIETFTKRLASSIYMSFNVNASDNEYVYFIYPSSFSEPTFFVGGFEGGFNKIGEIQFTNMYSYTESYDIFVSTNANLGSMTVEVK